MYSKEANPGGESASSMGSSGGSGGIASEFMRKSASMALTFITSLLRHVFMHFFGRFFDENIEFLFTSPTVAEIRNVTLNSENINHLFQETPLAILEGKVRVMMVIGIQCSPPI